MYILLYNILFKSDEDYKKYHKKKLKKYLEIKKSFEILNFG